jgi:hypothetical protein
MVRTDGTAGCWIHLRGACHLPLGVRGCSRRLHCLPLPGGQPPISGGVLFSGANDGDVLPLDRWDLVYVSIFSLRPQLRSQCWNG